MKFSDPITETPEGRLLTISRDLLKAVEKNMTCMHKAGETCKNCYKPNRGDEKKPRLPSPKGGKNKLKSDATSEFLRERGIIAKYEQEHSVDNQVPQFHIWERAMHSNPLVRSLRCPK